MPAKQVKTKGKAVEQRSALAETEQVSRGQELLQILWGGEQDRVLEQLLPSDSCAAAGQNPFCSDECDETDVKVIVKHTFIEVIDPECKQRSRAKARSRAMSDSALLHSSGECTWLSEPLPTVTDLSDASTTVSESQEESQPEELSQDNENLGGFDRIRTDTCWSESDQQGMDIYMQQPYFDYQYMESWWMPMMSPDGTTTMMCAAMPDGSFMPQQWPEQNITDCEDGMDAEETDGEWRTTVMLRNMPNNYTRDMLLELMDAMGFEACYDFAYLPVDFKSQAGLGYAFINFISTAEAQRCFDEFEGFSDWKVPSEKVCTVTWGSPYQGFEAHVERYRNSPVMHHSIPDEWKPVLFDEEGMRAPFPVPTKTIKTPKVRQPPTSS